MVKLFVEGGGDTNQLRTKLRAGFARFLEKAGFKGRMPRIVACGGRGEAYDDFCKSFEGKELDSILLVDSEEQISARGKWDHVQKRQGDHWTRPEGAAENDIHFMVSAMEAWLHADRDALQAFFGPEFRADSLSAQKDVEKISKQDLYEGLSRATKNCKKGHYSKGGHSFDILAKLDPVKVRKASPHADQFLRELDNRLPR